MKVETIFFNQFYTRINNIFCGVVNNRLHMVAGAKSVSLAMLGLLDRLSLELMPLNLGERGLLNGSDTPE